MVISDDDYEAGMAPADRATGAARPTSGSMLLAGKIWMVLRVRGASRQGELGDDEGNLEHVMRRKQGRGHPPERFHVFVSYTTREEEVRIVKPIVDRFLETVLRPAIEETLGEPPAFYDGYSLYDADGPRLSTHGLKNALRFAIEESEVLIAFVSPEYPGSQWCRFECSTMASKQHRPWFDLFRVPPIPELRDQRPPDLRPNWWERVVAAFLMWRWRLREEPLKPGGAIVIVLWKGEVHTRAEMLELRGVPIFDWTSCGPAIEASAQVCRHLLRHGSVSPGWELEAQEFNGQCEDSMRATATAVVEILRRRRTEYAVRH